MDDLSAWPTDFAWGEVPPPERWEKPGVVMFFNLECAGCVSRGVPWLKRLAAEHGDALYYLLIHTAYGHRAHPREEVVAGLERFAEFARLTVPVALDLTGTLALGWGVEGTPHWLVFGAGGELLRSIYGSQENATTRLEYLLEELTAPQGPGR